MPLDPSQQITIAGVQCWDEFITQENFVTYGVSSATRQVLCAWNDRIELMIGLLGIGGVNSASQYTYNPASGYPDFPLVLYAQNVQNTMVVSTIGISAGIAAQLTVGPNGMVAAPLCRSLITYKSLPYDQDNLNVTAVDTSVEEVTVPKGTFEFTNYPGPPPAGHPIDQTVIPSMRVVTVNFTITQYNQPELPEDQIASVAGCVNSTSIFGWDAPQTVCFTGAKSNRRVTVAGKVNQDLCYNLSYITSPGYPGCTWNTKLDPIAAASGASIWQPVRNTSDRSPVYTVADIAGVLGLNNPTGMIP